ncbi:MAG: GMP/IMP nucleotidase [Oceanococcaceae bacterium]
MSAALDWSRIDTVLCDMDGTVLDLGFDNHFWMDAIPTAWGERRGLSCDEARQALLPLFERNRGQLHWYCVDFWTRELGLDVRALKDDHAHRIAWLPGVEPTLRALRAQGVEMVLLTNAHPHVLEVKQRRTNLLQHFDRAHSTHEFGRPKEQPAFWPNFARATGIDLPRALMIDDTDTVLDGALAGGVGQVLAVQQPSTRHPARCFAGRFVQVHTLAELTLPPLPSTSQVPQG